MSQKIITQATNISGLSLAISVSTEERPLFQFEVKSYSSPFLVDDGDQVGVKFLHVDNLRWCSPEAKAAAKSNKLGYSRGDPAPMVMLEQGASDEITEEEIKDLYSIVRYGKRTWPMGPARIWIKRWLSRNQTLIGVDYFSPSDSTSDLEE